MFAKVNNLGFIETPYYKVENGVVDMSESKYLSAEEEEGKLFAQANIAKDKTGKIVPEKLIARSEADYPVVDRKEVDFTDVAPNQICLLYTSPSPRDQ